MYEFLCNIYVVDCCRMITQHPAYHCYRTWGNGERFENVPWEQVRYSRQAVRTLICNTHPAAGGRNRSATRWIWATRGGFFGALAWERIFSNLGIWRYQSKAISGFNFPLTHSVMKVGVTMVGGLGIMLTSVLMKLKCRIVWQHGN